MKKRILKPLGVFITVGVLMALFLISVSAKTVVSGDFKFEVADKTATLTEYTGSAKTVKIPSKVGSATVTKIADEAFWQKTAMTSVTIPSTVTAIGDAAFNECTGLTKVVIPSKVKSIGEGAFWACKNLESIVIPASVTKIGDVAFKHCGSLTAYVVKGSYGEKYIKTAEGVKLGYRYATDVKLSDTSVKLTVGDTDTIKATLSPSPLYNGKIKFSSSDSSIVKVSSSGKLTAVAPGKAVITVTARDGSGKTATCTVTVNPTDIAGLTATAPTKTGLTLKWSASKGAAGYSVYKYDSANKKWIKLGNTSKTQYAVSDLGLASKTRFRVRAYKKYDGKYYYSSYSYIYGSTLAPAKVEGLKAAATTDFINLTWSKAENADGYKVYVYDAAKDEFVYKAKTTSLKYKLTSLEANTAYTFAVRAYISSGKNTADSKYLSDSLTYNTRPDYVQGFESAANSVYFNRLTLSWDILPGVTGYQIALKGADGDFSNIKTLYGDVDFFTFTGLTANTEYTYKIRSFTKSGGETYFGYYGDEVTVRTLNVPSSDEEALETFNAALTATKGYMGELTVYEQSSLGEVSVTPVDYDFNEASLGFGAGMKAYNFKDNTLIGGDATVSDTFTEGSDRALTLEDIAEGTLKYKENGSGFDISFTLKAEAVDAPVAAAIIRLIDWTAVAEGNESFGITACDYTGTVITAKVQDEKISFISAEIPFEATAYSGETEVTLVGSGSRFTAFTYGD